MTRNSQSPFRWLFLGVAAASLFGLSACGGSDKKQPLPGERISILQLERALEPDPRISDVAVRLPRPWENSEWPQPGGYANHVMHHLLLGNALREVWRTSIGNESDKEQRIIAEPVVADGVIFAMDSESNVSAYTIDRGRRIWNVDLTPKGEDAGLVGGGIAFDNGKLYVTTAYGEIYALDAKTGKPLWKMSVGIPFRGAPAVDNYRVFAISHDNQMHVVDASSGRALWQLPGITETAGLLGAASPALDGGLVIVPFSSGELFAVRAENGAVAWQEQLTRASRTSSLGTINDINARPVIDRGLVFAVSHVGRMVAIDLRTGERVWDREIPAVQMPWIAGDFIFVVTTEAEVLCLSRRDGRIKWVRPLERWLKPESNTNKGLISWYGPVLAGDRLVLVSSHAQAVSISPYDGKVLGRIKLSDGAATAPVISNGMLFFLTEDARLVALR